MRTVIFFDLYGTLVLTHNHRHAWSAWQEYLIEFVRLHGGKSLTDNAAELLGEFWNGEYDHQNKEMSLFEARLKSFFGRLSIEVEDDDTRKLANDLCGVWQGSLEIDPDAYKVLSRLRGKTGLVTNFDHPPHIRKLMHSTGLGVFFNIVVVSGEEGTKKPAPDILLLACRRMGCKQEEAIYVGDSIVDFQAASSAGLQPVIIRRDGQEEIENTRDTIAGSLDVESLIAKKEKSGDLILVESLLEVPGLIGL